jgi:hypothetical protein
LDVSTIIPAALTVPCARNVTSFDVSIFDIPSDGLIGIQLLLLLLLLLFVVESLSSSSSTITTSLGDVYCKYHVPFNCVVDIDDCSSKNLL